jgi:hypothetical protein
VGIESRLQVASEEERIAAATSAQETGRKLRSVEVEKAVGCSEQ